MTIECHDGACPYHSVHTDPEDGPFCYESRCVRADSGKYDNREIARRLQATAEGETYDGNSLRVAKDIPGLTPEDIAVLEAWLTGADQRVPLYYRMRLQDIAIKVGRL